MSADYDSPGVVDGRWVTIRPGPRGGGAVQRPAPAFGRAVGVAPLAACGVRGPLTLPPPSTAAGAPTSETPGAAPTPAPQPRERKP